MTTAANSGPPIGIKGHSVTNILPSLPCFIGSPRMFVTRTTKPRIIRDRFPDILSRVCVCVCSCVLVLTLAGASVLALSALDLTLGLLASVVPTIYLLR